MPPLNSSSSFNLSCPLTSSPPGFSLTFAIIFGIPACLIIVVTIIGNFLVLSFKADIGKKQTALLVWNLGLADFLVGIFVLPMGVAHVIGGTWPFPRWVCKFWTGADVVFCTASIITLCVISVDRYIGVTKPLQYKAIVTKRRVVAAIVVIWILSGGILFTTVDYSDARPCIDSSVCRVMDELRYVVHSVVSAFFLPALITLILYWKIYVIARERERCLKSGLLITFGENFFTACVVNEPMRVHYGRQRNLSRQQRVIRMHKLVAKTLGVVVSAFILCWLPFFAIYLIGYNCKCIPGIVPDILTWLGYCNSMLNPIIYAFTIRKFKASVHRTISFWRSRLPSMIPAQGDLFDKEEELKMTAPEVTSKTIGVKKPGSGRVMNCAKSPPDVDLPLPSITDDNSELIWSAKAYALLISPQTSNL